MIDIEKIKVDPRTQSRVKLCESTINEYAEALRAGAKFPPVTLFFDGECYWLADGFHRYLASKKAGGKKIFEEIKPGSLHDAILHSLGANSIHGLRRSNADKRKSVETMLSDPEWSQWTHASIANACGVSREFVSRVFCDKKPPKETQEFVIGSQNQEPNDAAQQCERIVIGSQFDTSTSCDNAEEYTELDAAHEQIAELQNALSVAAQGDLGEEEKAEALNLVDSLRAEIKALSASLKAMTISRDQFQSQVAQLKRQCEIHRKEIAKLKAA